MVKNMMVQYQNTAYVKEDHMLKWAHTDGDMTAVMVTIYSVFTKY